MGREPGPEPCEGIFGALLKSVALNCFDLNELRRCVFTVLNFDVSEVL